MKKTLISLVAGAALVMTSSAFALQSMDSDTMKDTTGQAGVSITVDDVLIETWVGTTTYTDLDGTDGTAGSINITGKHTIQSFEGITGYDGSALFSPGNGLTQTELGEFNYDADGDGVRESFHAMPLTIDVGSCQILSEGLAFNNGAGVGTGSTAVQVVGVVIGLPTLEINTSADTYTVTASQAGAANDGAAFIQVSTGAKTQHILGGTIEIAPH